LAQPARSSHPNPGDHRIIDPGLLFVALVWGAGNVVVKWLLDVFEPSALFGLRMGLTSLLMLGLLWVRRRPISARDVLVLTLIGGGLVTVQQLCFVYAMNMTTASEGALLISTAPVWTAMMVALLGIEVVTWLNWLGIVIAFGGVAMVVLGAGQAVLPNAPARLAGDLLMIASAWMYGGYMVISGRWMKKIGALHVICCTFSASGLFLLLIGWQPLLATDWHLVTWDRWLGVAYLTVLAAFVSLIVWYRTIGRTSASRTAVYQYLVPGISVVAAGLFLHERLAILQVAGIVITLIGVYLARVPSPAVERPAD